MESFFVFQASGPQWVAVYMSGCSTRMSPPFNTTARFHAFNHDDYNLLVSLFTTSQCLDDPFRPPLPLMVNVTRLQSVASSTASQRVYQPLRPLSYLLHSLLSSSITGVCVYIYNKFDICRFSSPSFLPSYL